MANEVRQCRLEPKTEFRFELEPGEALSIKLVAGHAEVFGAELPLDRVNTFRLECKAAVYTWHGCTLEMSGHAAVEYVAEETPMVPFANCHIALEQLRVKAAAHLRDHPTDPPSSRPAPPRVLVIGPENSGKTTTSKILLNYALRSGQGWSPIVVNLDPRDGAWTVPGTISVCHVTLPVLTTVGFNPYGSTATSAPSPVMFSTLLPLVYWYGHEDVKQNPDLLLHGMKNLAANVNAHQQANPDTSSGGLIIDTPAAFSVPIPNPKQPGDKYPLLTACIEEFQVNTVVVVGNEKLNAEMQRMCRGIVRPITVVKVPKSGGVVELDALCRRRLLSYQVKAYFYGLQGPEQTLFSAPDTEAWLDSVSPASTVLNFEDLLLYRIGSESFAPSSALPIGAVRVVSALQPVSVDPALPSQQSRLLNALVAVLAPADAKHAKDDAETRILQQNVAGFIVITSIDHEHHKFTVLAPSSTTLEGRIGVLGSLEWQDL